MHRGTGQQGQGDAVGVRLLPRDHARLPRTRHHDRGRVQAAGHPPGRAARDLPEVADRRDRGHSRVRQGLQLTPQHP